jgi:hypothetical protein
MQHPAEKGIMVAANQNQVMKSTTEEKFWQAGTPVATDATGPT